MSGIQGIARASVEPYTFGAMEGGMYTVDVEVIVDADSAGAALSLVEHLLGTRCCNE